MSAPTGLTRRISTSDLIGNNSKTQVTMDIYKAFYNLQNCFLYLFLAPISL